jgi:hypothetical protein
VGGSVLSGPAPKREAERRRRNKDGIDVESINLDELIKIEVEVPVADERWEPITKNFWDAFTRSGQSIFYEPTDWMTAYTLMEVLDRWLKPQEVRVGEVRPGQNEGGPVTYTFEEKIVAMPGGVLTAILKGLTALMANEGDRRKLRIELERRGAIDAALGGAPVVSITQKRDDAFAAAAAAKQQQQEA